MKTRTKHTRLLRRADNPGRWLPLASGLVLAAPTLKTLNGSESGAATDGGGAATDGGYPAAKAGRGAGGGDAGGLGANWERRDQLNSTAQGMEMGGSARKITCRVNPPAEAPASARAVVEHVGGGGGSGGGKCCGGGGKCCGGGGKWSGSGGKCCGGGAIWVK